MTTTSDDAPRRTSQRTSQRNEALRDTWFDAAGEILATEGYGGLKLAPLCKRLGVTTGSFYHSFDNWQDFTDTLLANWLQVHTAQTVEIVNEHSDPIVGLQMLAEASTDLQHRTEAAIRTWAGVDDRVKEIQRRVDTERYSVVRDAMLILVGPEQADLFTVWGISTLIGFETIAGEHEASDLGWALGQILEAASRAGQ